MSAQSEHNRQEATVALRGPLTLGEPSNLLRTSVRQLLDSGINAIRLDLSQVPYADAEGLGAIAQCNSMAAMAGATLGIEGFRGKLREELNLTGLIVQEPDERSGDRSRRDRESSRRRAASPLRIVHSGAA